jgi:hypothetical protein
MIEDLFNHKCDIYHFDIVDNPPKYGLPSTTSKEYKYNEEPDLVDIICHFNVHPVETITISEPQRNINHDVTLLCPLDTDIRFNDKVIDKETSLIYYAQKPRNIRNSHLKIQLFMERQYV